MLCSLVKSNALETKTQCIENNNSMHSKHKLNALKTRIQCIASARATTFFAFQQRRIVNCKSSNRKFFLSLQQNGHALNRCYLLLDVRRHLLHPVHDAGISHIQKMFFHRCFILPQRYAESTKQQNFNGSG